MFSSNGVIMLEQLGTKIWKFYKCCTSDVDGIRKWALAEQSEDSNCNHWKNSMLCAVFLWNIAQNLLFHKA